MLEEKYAATQQIRLFNPHLLEYIYDMQAPSAEFITTARLVLAYVYDDRFLKCSWQDIVDACAQPVNLNDDLLMKLSQLSDVYLIDTMC